MVEVEFVPSGNFLSCKCPFSRPGGHWLFLHRGVRLFDHTWEVTCWESSRLRLFISQYPYSVGVTTRSGRGRRHCSTGFPVWGHLVETRLRTVVLIFFRLTKPDDYGDVIYSAIKFQLLLFLHHSHGPLDQADDLHRLEASVYDRVGIQPTQFLFDHGN